ncbi:META domain-containing protein [Gluconobacter kanchanaburiensis]|uniref:DUF306 domain-containing protein n=1 Tax=Gluconobacter kanchanaburiensis NBRC 103587 TaxID=1307948 RepID=A0A511B3E5_9PROT|nr:META domain-containing protein [Gluconobacter kanchanaburiensis]MBF0860859.1 META domain-containing protein [Gluconobacter kanchanaburiensis]GBR69931.1 hypothetical protein AA103587_1595 [Gluconobacter kanchanaburiensis NBRC 103587]GEK94965.1 hypothetical protein GKA01_01620 [Gluconobacter kanchanaburiensis NBRC 103587]
MITIRRFVLTLLMTGSVLPVGNVWAENMHILHGQALYHERMALPPGAMLNVWIEDTAAAHGAPLVVAEQREEIQRAVPISYSLTYPPLPAGGHYTLNAEITVEGRRLFATSNEGVPLDHPALVLHRVAGSAVRVPYGTWGIQSLGDRHFENSADAPGLTLQQDGTVYGSDGCNRLMGHFRIEGQNLHFLPFAMTRRACLPPLMLQEQLISRYLPTVTSWSREGENRLELRAGASGETMLLVPRDTL